MAKNIELLLLQSVENLGIVGDVVRVKPGFARNYLLPQGLAESPTPTRVESLKEARAHAQAELAALREARQKMIEQLTDISVSMVRACNDQGGLYGSVTQRDISDALMEAGHGISPEFVRLAHPIRHVGEHAVPIQFEKELRADITLIVEPDHPLDTDEPAEIEGEEGGEAKNEATEPTEETAASH